MSHFYQDYLKLGVSWALVLSEGSQVLGGGYFAASVPDPLCISPGHGFGVTRSL